MRIAVLSPADIAFRRFLPSLQQIEDAEFVGVGVYDAHERFGDLLPSEEIVKDKLAGEEEKAARFTESYGGKIFHGWEKMLSSDEFDAVYIALPPALHYRWALKALENGKHVLVEKPVTIQSSEAKALVEVARAEGLALHEDYMFAFHAQLDAIDDIIASGEIGNIRLYRISFGFPMRAANDFRYDKALGGGALTDAAGYTIKYAARLLGPTARVKYAQLNYTDDFEVDLYGSGALVNADGLTVQVAFGMDNNYKCELEAWGSKGCLTTGRVLTAPAGFAPDVVIRKGNEEEVRKLPADDAFRKSIEHFIKCISDEQIRKENYEEILKQVELVESFQAAAEL